MIQEHPTQNIAIHTWDWKCEPNWEVINLFSQGLWGTPVFYEVYTNQDDYAVLITDIELTKEQVQEHWDNYYNGDWDIDQTTEPNF